MNLPEYIRALGDAAEQFEKDVAGAAEKYRNAFNKARSVFFEDDVPMSAREETYRKDRT